MDVFEERVRWRPTPAGRASNYLLPFEIRYPSEPIVLWCRVSERMQRYCGNCDDQEAAMTAAVNAAGGRVVATVAETASGTYPVGLALAVVQARHHGGRILAETTDRYIRSELYKSKKHFQDVQASEHDLRWLAFWLEGVEAMTLLHPDATPTEVRSYQCIRGQTEKGRKGGRPTINKPGYKKERHAAARPRVIELKAAGAKLATIMEETGVKRRTIQRWLADAKAKAK